MCLYYSQHSTDNVRRQFNKQTHLPKHLRKIICFKYLRITRKKTITSPSFNTKWKIGWMKSNRCGLSIMQDNLDGQTPWHKTVSRGIHVYLASNYDFYKTRCLKVWCYEKDFVGAGDGEAVFAKVFVTKEHWNEFCRKNKINGVK